MESKTIKISEDSYRKLLAVATELQRKREEKVTFDDTIQDLVDKKKKGRDIMRFAGSWKLSDKEAETLIKDIYKERKILSRRL